MIQRMVRNRTVATLICLQSAIVGGIIAGNLIAADLVAEDVVAEKVVAEKVVAKGVGVGNVGDGNAAIGNVGSERQLFIDTAFFEQSENVRLELHSAKKTDEKVLLPDQPWESATINWFNVMQDAGVIDKQAKYRMWYEAYDVPGWPTNDDISFCYAESRDGVHWTKPNLGLFDYYGNKNNNILFRQIGPEVAHSRTHGTCVFIDPTAPPEARYKAVSQGQWKGSTPPYRVAGMVSPDGLTWTRCPKPICDVFADSQYSGFWDSRLGKYVLYGRTFANGGRTLGRSESGSFQEFAPFRQVLQADHRDPPNSDLYNPAAIKYSGAANVYMMFPSLYQHDTDTLDIRMVVSRDGVNWTYPDQSKAFIPLGDAGTWDSKSLYLGQGLIEAGDEIWLYYFGSSLCHNEGELKDYAACKLPRGFSRVVVQRNRFVSAEAVGPHGGWFVTQPLQFVGNMLTLNVDVRSGGKVRVGLLDENGNAIPGRGVEDCLEIAGDHFDAGVRWKSGSDVGDRAGRPTRLRIEWSDASLFGFQFTTGQQ
jgi:hypothetical protein